MTRWAGAAVVAAGLGGATLALHAHDPITTRVTWHGEIARIVRARCLTCHTEGGRGPMSLETYEAARPWARAIREEVVARRMPKWHAARGYGDFRNDRSLSPFEIALIAAWVDGGAPKGVETGRTEAAQAAADSASSRLPDGKLRHVTLPCRAQPAPRGRLTAFRPAAAEGESIGIALRDAAGRHTILGWIRGFDPDFTDTYWLRRPVEIGRGATLLIEGSRACSLTLFFSGPR